jgi:hypothetical protein
MGQAGLVELYVLCLVLSSTLRVLWTPVAGTSPELLLLLALVAVPKRFV